MFNFQQKALEPMDRVKEIGSIILLQLRKKATKANLFKDFFN